MDILIMEELMIGLKFIMKEIIDKIKEGQVILLEIEMLKIIIQEGNQFMIALKT